MTAQRTYGTAAFAALAGVTPRALRHYDRLGLLKPRRTDAGYRRYDERDLEPLEEIVALKFIGVPLKQIGAIRQRPERPFAEILRAQREALDAKRRTLTKAVEAIAAAEAQLRSRAAIEADAIRSIIEVMHMEQNHEELIKTYGTMLKAKVSYLTSLSDEERTALKQQWSALIVEVRSAAGEDPAGPKAQELLERWLSLQRATIGGTESIAPPPGLAPLPDNPAPELRSELWARRTEWLPADVARKAANITDANAALASSRALASSFIGDDVFEFIAKAKAARGL